MGIKAIGLIKSVKLNETEIQARSDTKTSFTIGFAESDDIKLPTPTVDAPVKSVNTKIGNVVLNGKDIKIDETPDAKNITETLTANKTEIEQVKTELTPIKEKLIFNGDGTKYLADDGTYKEAGGSGGGAVDSVNGKTGEVVLTGIDIKTSAAEGANTINTELLLMNTNIDKKMDKTSATLLKWGNLPAVPVNIDETLNLGDSFVYNFPTGTNEQGWSVVFKTNNTYILATRKSNDWTNWTVIGKYQPTDLSAIQAEIDETNTKIEHLQETDIPLLQTNINEVKNTLEANIGSIENKISISASSTNKLLSNSEVSTLIQTAAGFKVAQYFDTQTSNYNIIAGGDHTDLCLYALNSDYKIINKYAFTLFNNQYTYGVIPKSANPIIFVLDERNNLTPNSDYDFDITKRKWSGGIDEIIEFSETQMKAINSGIDTTTFNKILSDIEQSKTNIVELESKKINDIIVDGNSVINDEKKAIINIPQNVTYNKVLVKIFSGTQSALLNYGIGINGTFTFTIPTQPDLNYEVSATISTTNNDTYAAGAIIKSITKNLANVVVVYKNTSAQANYTVNVDILVTREDYVKCINLNVLPKTISNNQGTISGGGNYKLATFTTIPIGSTIIGVWGANTGTAGNILCWLNTTLTNGKTTTSSVSVYLGNTAGSSSANSTAYICYLEPQES